MNRFNVRWSRYLAVSVLALACVFSIRGTRPQPLLAQNSLPLVYSSGLRYDGAFRLPSGVYGGSQFAYGGGALTYNPTQDSLFMTGHSWDQQVAEVSIPAPSLSGTVTAMPVASVLQPFYEITEGKKDTAGDPNFMSMGGMMVFGGQLVGAVLNSYDANGVQVLSHFTRPLTLSQTGSVQGLYRIGTRGAGWVASYMTMIPPEWRSALGGPALTGGCCMNIVWRTSYGPSAFVFDPAVMATQDPTPAAAALYYTSDHQLGGYETQNLYWNGTTQMGGLVFPTGTRSVLFIGRHGVGPFCYGDGGPCGDPAYGDKGTHAYPYVYQVWAYDALDLVAVKNGQKQPYELVPYAIWQLTLPFSTDQKDISGATYDSQTQRFWVSQSYGDSERPLIHQFTVTVASTSSTPSPPTNLQIVAN